MLKRSQILFAACLVSAPLLTIGSAPGEACGWYGDRGRAYYAPRAYGYRAYYRPVTYAGVYRPRVWGWRGRGMRRW
jgi:hypothetical protein